MFDQLRQQFGAGMDAYRVNQEQGYRQLEEMRAEALLALQAKAVSGAVAPVEPVELPAEEQDVVMVTAHIAA